LALGNGSLLLAAQGTFKDENIAPEQKTRLSEKDPIPLRSLNV
jgi:hypothetical protein